ncbi:MAG: YjjG family noncanonical pyrimidine nucleotidase [Clostridia bacterium]|nr:YjjG family noncanonical pyrimidine nucleotidase [Clostridia bacterium]
MKFKAIFMDNDGTLMDFKAAEANALNCVIDQLGIDSPDAPEVYSRINDQCWKDFEKGLITQEQLRLRRFRELMEYFGCGYEEDKVKITAETYVEELSHQNILLPGALDVVKQISAHLPVYILTNGISKVQHGRIDTSPLAPYLSGLLISTEIGAPKPAPDMYLRALEMAQIEPCEALMIGDSLSSDIRGAVNLGIPACWYNPERKMKPEWVIGYEIHHIHEMADVALMD